MEQMQIVLVTGCSFGLGTNIAMKFAGDPRQCYKVWAAVRVKEESELITKLAGDFLNKTLFVCDIDLSSKDSIVSTVNTILKTDGRVDILVNNGVCNYFCPFENLEMAAVRRVMEVNFFGHLRIIHMILPTMKKRRHGRVISIGSMGAVGVNSPFCEFFDASKNALAIFGDNMNGQLRSYNVWFSIVHPGAIRTQRPIDIFVNRNYKDIVRVPCGGDDVTNQLFENYLELLSNSYSSGYAQEPDSVADVVKEVSEKEKPLAMYQTDQNGTALAANTYKDTTGEVTVKHISAMLGL